MYVLRLFSNFSVFLIFFLAVWEKERFGMECEGYKWGQSVHSVEVYIPKKPGTSGKSYDIKFTPETLRVSLKGQEEPIIDGRLWQKVKVEDCLWMIEDDEEIFDGEPHIYIHLGKVRSGRVLRRMNETCLMRKSNFNYVKYLLSFRFFLLFVMFILIFYTCKHVLILAVVFLM